VILSQSDIKILKWYKAMGVDEIHSNTTRTYIKKNENNNSPTSIVLPKEKIYVEKQVAERAAKYQMPNNLLDASVLLELTSSEIYSYACKIKDKTS
jgi:hypothetical protein